MTAFNEEISTYKSLAAATTGTAKATPCRLLSAVVHNGNAATRFFQLYDTTSTTTPILFQAAVPAGDSIGLTIEHFGTKEGLNFDTGLTWGMSTTSGSYVAATAGETNVVLRIRG